MQPGNPEMTRGLFSDLFFHTFAVSLLLLNFLAVNENNVMDFLLTHCRPNRLSGFRPDSSCWVRTRLSVDADRQLYKITPPSPLTVLYELSRELFVNRSFSAEETGDYEIDNYTLIKNWRRYKNRNRPWLFLWGCFFYVWGVCQCRGTFCFLSACSGGQYFCCSWNVHGSSDVLTVSVGLWSVLGILQSGRTWTLQSADTLGGDYHLYSKRTWPSSAIDTRGCLQTALLSDF